MESHALKLLKRKTHRLSSFAAEVFDTMHEAWDVEGIRWEWGQIR
jgi:hypothetical protein